MKTISIRAFVAGLLTTVSFGSTAWGAVSAPDAEKLLRAADRSRGGAEMGLSWMIDVQSREEELEKREAYAIKTKGTDAVAECTAPARSKGETLLFNDRNIWMHKPGLSKPVSISPRQRLSGQASNGDIASTNYARDYEGKVVGEETVAGKKAYVLELKARGKNVTYDRIRYWITKDSQLGVKAEFLTLQGKPFKVAEFEYANQLDTGSGQIPFVSKMTIRDASFPENVTVVDYTRPKRVALSDAAFNVNNLSR